MSKIVKLFGAEQDPSWFLPPYGKEIIIPSDLDIQRFKYLELSDEEQYNYRERLRQHILSLIAKGHSVFGQNQDSEEIISDIKKLINISDMGFLEYYKGKKLLRHSNFNVSNQWFPEMYDTKINGKSCLDQIRNHDDFHQNFYDIFNKDRHKAGENKQDRNSVSDTLIDSMRIVNGFQPAFNFPATLAKFIYRHYFSKYMKNATEFRVCDPCMGWSGRMTGLLAAFCNNMFTNVKVSYHGTDVNTQTNGRFENIVGFWQHYINSRIATEFNLHRSFTPAESLLQDSFFSDKEGFYDFAFTSPPYWAKEQYSDDETQSYKMYPTYPEWKDGFLQGLINSTYKLLKPGAKFWLNIADINTNRGDGSFYPLEEDAIILAQKIGFQHVDTYYMLQHPFPGSYSTKNIIKVEGKRYKYEPIFCFLKGR